MYVLPSFLYPRLRFLNLEELAADAHVSVVHASRCAMFVQCIGAEHEVATPFVLAGRLGLATTCSAASQIAGGCLAGIIRYGRLRSFG